MRDGCLQCRTPNAAVAAAIAEGVFAAAAVVIEVAMQAEEVAVAAFECGIH